MQQKTVTTATATGRAMRVTIIDHHMLFADSLSLVLEDAGYVVSEVEPWQPDACLAGILAKSLRSAARLVLLDESLGRLGDSTRLIAPLAAAGAAVVVLVEPDGGVVGRRVPNDIGERLLDDPVRHDGHRRR